MSKEERRERGVVRKVVRDLEIFSSYSQMHLILEIPVVANGEVHLYWCLSERLLDVPLRH